MSGQVTLYGVNYTFSLFSDSNCEGLLTPTETDGPGDPQQRFTLAADVDNGGAFIYVNGLKYHLITQSNEQEVASPVSFGPYVLQNIVCNPTSSSVDVVYYNALLDTPLSFALFVIKDYEPVEE